MAKSVTTATFREMKKKGEKITMLTAYDWPTAQLLDAAGVDSILVGDSVAMVVQGNETSLPVTMDQMIYHTKLVARGVHRAMVIGDMPFMSYQASTEDAIRNAGRFLKEGDAQCIKLEGGAAVCDVIEAITKADIPVMAHIGLTPQSVHKFGGFKIQREEQRLIDDARKVQDAGAFSVVLECIPTPIATKITEAVEIPTIGIGAGPNCDGQVLVFHDLVGLFERFVPKFVKRYAECGKTIKEAVSQFCTEVRDGTFPGPEHQFEL